MTSKATNANLDDHVDTEIASYLDIQDPRSFFLYAGAGSGKTTSLVKALQHIKSTHLSRLELSGQKVAVVTYTNAACEEIIRRTAFDPTYHVSTIHSFCWQLIDGFNRDIREWLRSKLTEDIAELLALEAKGRAGTKASADRQAQIDSKNRRLARLNEIKKFIYSATGDNRERNSLNHSEVIEICASFLSEKKLLQSILVSRYPFFLVDESQDTNKHIVDALLRVQSGHSTHFCLGFIGDSMQRIYSDGKENIELDLPKDWRKPAKRLNHRCPKRVVELINLVRSQVDTHMQEPRDDSIEGTIRLFVFPDDVDDKAALEDRVRLFMANAAGDDEWNDHLSCKILTLEHHMAARRMGFASIYESLSRAEQFRTGLMDGTLPATRLFTKLILPLVQAAATDDRFMMAKIVRESSQLLSPDRIKEVADQREQLHKAEAAVKSLMKLWNTGTPTCRVILDNISKTELFPIPESLRAHVGGLNETLAIKGDTQAEKDDPLSANAAAIELFLESSFDEILPYSRYISNEAEFGTHQGVKGLEFDRVMVLMEDKDARGFLFGYEKFLGAKELTPTDIKNIQERKDSSLGRTRRLFYVTCSRARKSLALVVYTSSPESVRALMIKNGWFKPGEIILELPLI